MSLDALKWALKEAPIPKSQSHMRTRLVLVYLADRHNTDTGVAWPSVGRIAKELDTSQTTVRSALNDLQKLGLISPGSPDWVRNYPEGRRPNVWRLNLNVKRPDDDTAPTDGCTPTDLFTPTNACSPTHTDPSTPTPTDGCSPGVQTVVAKPKENQKKKPKEQPKDLVPADKSAAPSLFDPPAGKPISELTDEELRPLFEKFWDAHPQKAAKEETFKELRKALKKTTFSNLVEKAEIYARWVENEGIEWGAVIRSHNWLKGGRWDDELRFTDRSRPAGPSFNDIAGQMLNETRNNGKELDW